MTKPTISTIIVIKGNPPHALESIQSVEDMSDEVLIGDIGMDVNLKAQLVLNIPKIQVLSLAPIPYVELVREDLKKIAKGDFIFFLDPDEVVPADLKKEILGNLNTFDYCSMPRKNIIFGKWIEHSRWWPDYQIRFFRKDTVTWPKEIHKQPVVSGVELKLEAKEKFAITHHNYESLDEYLEKAIRYAKAEADEKENTEFKLSDAVSSSLSEFISRFFAEDGYKDGMHGFVLALLQMFYGFLVYFYWWENNKHPKIDEKELLQNTSQYFKQGLNETGHWMNQKGIKKTGLRGKLLAKLLKP